SARSSRRMARENPTWGRRRIQAELRFLGYEGRGAHRCQVHAAPLAPAIRDVACLPRGAYSRHCRRRLLRCPHAHLPFALRVLDPSTPPSKTRRSRPSAYPRATAAPSTTVTAYTVINMPTSTNVARSDVVWKGRKDRLVAFIKEKRKRKEANWKCSSSTA